MQLLAELAARTAEASAADPGHACRRLTEHNAAAVTLHKASDHISALAAYALLFRRQRAHNLAHAELHVCYTCVAQCTVVAWLCRACTYREELPCTQDRSM